jgi:hypothetical protein
MNRPKPTVELRGQHIAGLFFAAWLSFFLMAEVTRVFTMGTEAPMAVGLALSATLMAALVLARAPLCRAVSWFFKFSEATSEALVRGIMLTSIPAAVVALAMALASMRG